MPGTKDHIRQGFDLYADAAGVTAVYPNRGGNLYYPALGLGGETGEVLEKIKKLMRDRGGEITPEFREALKKEMGDILWYVAAIAYEAGISLGDVAAANLEKLASRAERGKIQGSGDDR